MLAVLGGLILSTVPSFARTSLTSVQEHALAFLGATANLRPLAPRVALALAVVPFLLAERPVTSARIAIKRTCPQNARNVIATVWTTALIVKFAMLAASASLILIAIVTFMNTLGRRRSVGPVLPGP